MKKGFTLMELLVYMAIVGIVVVLAGQVFSDSTKMRVRTQSMLSANATAGEVALLISEDVAQTGAKSSKELSATLSDEFKVSDSIYINPNGPSPDLKDSSSFRLAVNATTHLTDSLIFRRVHYAEDGKFRSVEEVSLFVEDGKLYRSCRTIPNTSSTADESCPEESKTSDVTPVEIMDRIDSFRVLPAKPRILSSVTTAEDGSTIFSTSENNSAILPDQDPSIKNFRLVPRYGDEEFYFANTSPADGGSAISISGFASNYSLENKAPIEDGKKANQLFVAQANSAPGTWKTLCKKINLEPQVEYEISFIVPFVANDSRLFCPGRDYASVGFRDQSGQKFSGLDDFLFYFPSAQTDSKQRIFRFSVDKRLENACMAFTFASYSPVVPSSTITLQNVSLRKVATSSFEFDPSYVPMVSDKKNVKAFRLMFNKEVNGEVSRVNQIILIPSNGPRD